MRRSSGTSGSRSIIPRWTSAAQRTAVNDTRKFRQQAVTGVLNSSAPVLLDLRINELREMRFEAFVRSFLIRTHQARIAGHISGKDRSETADRGHFSPGGRLA